MTKYEELQSYLLNNQSTWLITGVAGFIGSNLLEKLLVILNAAGNKDLRVCGVAALSSAMILRLKVESIFALEKIAMQHKSTPDRSILENLEVLDMPYRYEATYPVSLEDLLGVLENMLGRITNPKKKELEISKQNIFTNKF